MSQKRILFWNPLSPGDVLVSTAVIRDLHKAYPGEYITGYKGSAPEIFENNPYITPMADGDGMVVELQYPAIHQCNQRPVHFLTAYHEYVSMGLGRPIPVTLGRPDVHLSDDEKQWTDQIESIIGTKMPFWILVCGGKSDFTTKWWNPEYARNLVERFKDEILFVQVGAADHFHTAIPGAISLLGKTDIRQLMRLCYHSSGVVTPISFMMHMAAAFNKPAVVTAGGREPVPWESYPNHQYLHTVGALPCCKTSACWKSRVEKLNDGDEQDHSICQMPEGKPGHMRAACQNMITADKVEGAIRMYLRGSPDMVASKDQLGSAQPFLTR